MRQQWNPNFKTLAMYNYGRGPRARFAVSTVVVTRDRNRDCTQAIDSLLKQTVPPAEIIVVDSASMTPFTYAHPKVKVIRTDSDMGLSVSRNLAIQASTGDIVAFLDDDAMAHQDWIRGICTSIQTADVVGGPVIPLYASTCPRWTNAPGLSYVTGCSENGVIIGCNMAVRKEIFQEVGYFNPSLGRKQGRLLSAEEFEFLDRARQHGMQIRFTESMKVYHKIPPSRLTFRYLFNRLIWEGISRYIILRERKTQLNILAMVWAGITSDCLRILIFRGHRLSPFALAVRFGELYGLIYGARLLEAEPSG